MNVDQAIGGRTNDLIWTMVDEVERAFTREAGSMSGAEMLENAEITNALLRTAWPFVLKAIEGVRRG